MSNPRTDAPEVQDAINNAAEQAANIINSPNVPLDVRDAIDKAVEQAQNAINEGKAQVAMDIIDEARWNHSSHSVAHLCSFWIYLQVCTAQLVEDEDEYRRLMESGARFMEHAYFLSAESIYLLHAYTSVLYSRIPTSGDRSLYEEVLEACNYVQGIGHPTDPADDYQLLNNKISKLSTRETRIQHCQEMIWYTQRNAKHRSDQRSLCSVQASTAQRATASDQSWKANLYLGFLNRHDLKAMFSPSINDLRKATSGEVNLNVFESDSPDLTNSDSLMLAALSMAETNVPLKQWPCCYCDKLWFTADGHLKHVLEVHVGLLSEESTADADIHLVSLLSRRSKAALPQNIDKNSVECSIPSGCTSLDQESSKDLVHRNEILDRVREQFEFLANHSILTPSHLLMIRDLAEYEHLQRRNELKLNECIRYNSASYLENILSFLKWLQEANPEDLEDREAEEAVLETRHSPVFIETSEQGLYIHGQDYNDRKTLVGWLYDSSSGQHFHMLEWEKMATRSRDIIESLQEEFSFLRQLCEEKVRFSEDLRNLFKQHQSENQVENAVNKGSKSPKLMSSSKVPNESASQSPELGISGEMTRKRDDLRMQICWIDASIMWTLRTLHRLERKIGPASMYDYGISLMQLVKNFIQMRLEDEIANKLDGFLNQAFEDGDQWVFNEEDDHPLHGDNAANSDSSVLLDVDSKEQHLLHEST